MMSEYVHGYTPRESDRLEDQASALRDLLHGDTRYPDGAYILEAGCGVGAQTVILANHSPGARFLSVDISEDSITRAQVAVSERGFKNVSFLRGDIFNLPFADHSFDHVFVCFVLEHLRAPQEALAALRRLIRPGGTITVIEGDHGSAYFQPRNDDSSRLIEILSQLQSRGGGDALIGRALYPLLSGAGYADVTVSPRMVYADGSNPALQEWFTERTFTAMVEGIREKALSEQLVDDEKWKNGIDGLYRAAKPDGVFCYTFFKGVGYVK
jgi:ubiquinone/menaquinone biosynthesis C-methylase UbiE